MRPLISLALLSVPLQALPAENLGRLFFTPQQRQDLDRRRQANIQETAPATVESVITVNGYVGRTSGKGTIWMNGVPQFGATGSRDPAHVRLGGAEGEPAVDVKIGQTLDKTRGEIRDGLGSGSVKVRPAGSRAR